jgi:outer membrane biosynthesis protein TonB
VRVCGKGATLRGPEGSSPPLPFLNVTDQEGETLIRLGIAVRVADEDVEAPAEAPKPKAPPKAKVEAPAPPPPPAEETPPPPPPEAPVEAPKVEAEPAPKAEGNAEDRAETILHALDLVEPNGMEAEGDRKGKPTVQAIQEITGLSDVTVEEIDAAVAAHGAA